MRPTPTTPLWDQPADRGSLQEAQQDLLGPFVKVAGVVLGVVGFFSRFLPKSQTSSAPSTSSSPPPATPVP